MCLTVKVPSHDSVVSQELMARVFHAQMGFPHTAILGRLPGTNVYRNVKQYPEAQTIPGLLIVRIDAPFYFASVSVSTSLSQSFPCDPKYASSHCFLADSATQGLLNGSVTGHQIPVTVCLVYAFLWEKAC